MMLVVHLCGHSQHGYVAVGGADGKCCPASTSSPTISKLGPSLGRDLTGGHRTNPETFSPSPARSSGTALQLTLPLHCGAKTHSSPAQSETLPAPAFISLARRPGGSRTPSHHCSVAASQGHACVSHKHSGDSGFRHDLGTWAPARSVPARQRASASKHRPQISSSDLISFSYNVNPHGHILAVLALGILIQKAFGGCT